MKVLKFGGSSVGTPESIKHVKRIVERTNQPVIVVVSALSGVTDQLYETAHRAAQGDKSYRDIVAAMRLRHLQMVRDTIAPDQQDQLNTKLIQLFEELESILQGIFLTEELTQKTTDAVVSYGERLSSTLIAAAWSHAQLIDARTLIKTRPGHSSIVDFETTREVLCQVLCPLQPLTVVGGFIASDAQTGITTTLGRGGSDYTASIIAAALDAECLEIWTDVDGFMTADPHVIPTAYTIPELSYEEATELCNFGAKVVYPPTIYPVRVKGIPIYIKNTFRPEEAGSVIRSDAAPSKHPVRGISSVNETSMVTVSGMSMVGVVGVNRRIFGRITEAGISVFMVAQTSSETSTSLCVRPEDGPRACQVLDEEFSREIAEGAMNPAQLAEGLATIAVVGSQMKNVAGITGKLFTTLGRNGISVAASAQGALEINISLVVRREVLRKALNVLHDSFFLSRHQDLNVFLCGTGTVGRSLLQQINAQCESLLSERALRIKVVGITTRGGAAYDAEGLDPEVTLNASHPDKGIHGMVRQIKAMNLYNSVFVDCTASEEVAVCYQDLLEHNVSVVTANKVAASSDFANYQRLKETARDRGVKFLFETNVGAGLPVINTIRDLTGSGDKILRIEAVLSGTLNFVFNAISHDVSFSEAVRQAKEQGYSEPDPRIDLSGKDVIRKLTILARESGYRVECADIASQPFLPQELFAESLEAFWQELPQLDSKFETERQRLEAEGKHWRYVATWADGKGTVGLREIEATHPFFNIEGSNNIVLLTTARYHEYPMLIQGYGAGAAVTAAGVFADIMRVANI
ncbi:MAG: bifunctional aspartate kinase/homoserine dehydrogenase I [Bacteroidaceae bacterium]|nr:bifunctional aspartate kinase/homoserine dehydrogenase I [Bacteroidaceae bacterium]